MLKKISLIILLLFISFHPLLGSIKNILFDHLTISNGLSNNEIRSIIQDKEGFIWIGTEDGLNRYDGYGFKIFRNISGDTLSLTNNFINQVFEDSKQRIWIATLQGVSLYNKQNDSFTTYLKNLHIKSITETKDGNIIAGTVAGLRLIEPNKNKTARTRIIDWRPNNTIIKILPCSNHQILILTLSTIGYYNLKKRSYNEIEMPASFGVPNQQFTDCIFDRQNNLWIATSNGLFKKHASGNKVIQIEHKYPNVHINTLFSDNKNNIWIGTQSGLIIYLNNQNQWLQYTHNERSNSLNNNEILTIYESRHGVVWIGTYGGGINVYNELKNKFTHYNLDPGSDKSLSHNIVSAFLEAQNSNNVWIATWGGGLNYFNRKENEFVRYISQNTTSESHQVFRSLAQDNESNIWIATNYNGIRVFNPGTEQFRSYKNIPGKNGSIPTNSLYTTYIDCNGVLWIGTKNKGLCRYAPEEDMFFRYDLYDENITKPVDYVRIIIDDDQNHLWLGTHGGGIIRFNKKTGKKEQYHHISDKSPNYLTNDIVYSLIKDQNSGLWVGTMGGGLHYFNTKTQKFWNFTKNDGLSNNVVNGILQDKNNRIWLSTNYGINCFTPPAYLYSDTLSYAFFSTQDFKPLFQKYDVRDGLQSNEFKYASYYKNRAGEMFFGGVNGFTVFHPDSIKHNPYPPEVIITNFSLYYKSVQPGQNNSPLQTHISRTDEITLDYDQNYFTFEFVAINYTIPEKNQYAYYLEGFEDKWHYVGNQRKATYMNLTSGDYVFHIKAANNDGVWNQEGASIRIHINPPFWRTIWAFIAYLIFISFSMLILRRFILIQERIKNNMKIQRIHAEKAEEVYRLKLNFFTNISHEIRTPLTLIMVPLEKLMALRKNDTETNNYLTTMQRSVNRLLMLVNQLLDFRKIETGNLKAEPEKGDIIDFLTSKGKLFTQQAEIKNIQYTIHSSHNHLITLFDHDKLEKIIVNLLSNAFKFTPENGKITLEMQIKHNTDYNTNSMEVRVKDTGIGISDENQKYIFERFFQEQNITDQKNQGTGIGLSLTKQLVELLGGNISVESQKDHGSTFTFNIRLQKIWSDTDKVQDYKEIVMTENTATEPTENEKQSDASTVHINPNQKQKKELILIVEDNADVCNLIASELINQYQIQVAYNGKAGWDKTSELLPDLIISDIMMPEMNGIELCKTIKTNEITSHIPVILLTAKSSEESTLKGLETGADDYVTKPFNLNILKARIKNLIEQRRKLRIRFSKELNIDPKEITANKTDENFLKRAIQVVENNLDNTDFTVDDFSTKMAVSRSQLHQKLKALTNESASAFIRAIRLKHAVNLLKNTELNISEIAYRVGFSDPKYFTRCFKKQFNKAPSEIKKIQS